MAEWDCYCHFGMSNWNSTRIEEETFLSKTASNTGFHHLNLQQSLYFGQHCKWIFRKKNQLCDKFFDIYEYIVNI